MKRFLVGFLAVVGALALVGAIAIFLIIQTGKSPTVSIKPNTVVYLDFSLPISEAQTSPVQRILGQMTTSLYDMVQAIDQAREDPRVSGIVARLDFAMLGIAQCQEIRNAILRFRESGKFTLAYADSFGELGPGTISYYLATAFDEIWLQPIGQVGLSGLYLEVPFAKEAADKLGVEPQLSKRSEYKTALDSLTETGFTKENREALQAQLDSIISQITSGISKGREIAETDVTELIHRGPFLPPEAIKAGLIDQFAHFEDVLPTLAIKFNGSASYLPFQQYLQGNPPLSPQSGEPKIALIFGLGAIERAPSAMPDVLGSMTMGSGPTIAAFEKASSDPDVAAIVFRVNSPGGSPVASEAILHAVQKAQEKGKKVVVSMSDVAGSGGYWIVASADKIVAHPSTITGSIGVIAGKVVLKDLWEKLGIHWDSVYAGHNANMFSSNRRFTAYGWQRLDDWVDYIYQEFIQRVSKGRQLPPEHVEQVAKGRIWTGQDALKYGLVDQLGDLHDAIAIAKDLTGLKAQPVAVEIYPHPKTLSEAITEFFFGLQTETGATARTSILGRWSDLLESLDFIENAIRGGPVTQLPFKKVKG